MDPNQPSEIDMTEETKLTLSECHKKFAIDLFNLIWTMLEKSDRTADENEKMLQMAYASCYHWREAGTAIHQARGEWMISRVNAVLARPEAALHHAQRTLDICQQNDFGDFDLAFAYEAMARSSAAGGDKEGFEKYQRLAKSAGENIKEKEDKDIFMSDLRGGPWYGMS
jgi:hypothetical protein